MRLRGEAGRTLAGGYIAIANPCELQYARFREGGGMAWKGVCGVISKNGLASRDWGLRHDTSSIRHDSPSMSRLPEGGDSAADDF